MKIKFLSILCVLFFTQIVYAEKSFYKDEKTLNNVDNLLMVEKDIITKSKLFDSDVFEIHIRIPTWKIARGLINDICKQVRNPYGYFVCVGVLGVSAYLVNSALEGKSYSGTIAGYTCSIYNEDGYVHFVIGASDDENFEGCSTCS